LDEDRSGAAGWRSEGLLLTAERTFREKMFSGDLFGMRKWMAAERWETWTYIRVKD
jgi:hypothetical protein